MGLSTSSKKKKTKQTFTLVHMLTHECSAVIQKDPGMGS